MLPVGRTKKASLKSALGRAGRGQVDAESPRQGCSAGTLGLGRGSRRHLPRAGDMCRSREGAARLGPASHLSWGAVAAQLGHSRLVPQVTRNGDDLEAATAARGSSHGRVWGEEPHGLTVVPGKRSGDGQGGRGVGEKSCPGGVVRRDQHHGDQSKRPRRLRHSRKPDPGRPVVRGEGGREEKHCGRRSRGAAEPRAVVAHGASSAALSRVGGVRPSRGAQRALRGRARRGETAWEPAR